MPVPKPKILGQKLSFERVVFLVAERVVDSSQSVKKKLRVGAAIWGIRPTVVNDKTSKPDGEEGPKGSSDMQERS
jgi:hypothetical protein